MTDRPFELKLADGSRAEWDGRDGEDASRRWVDAHRERAIEAGGVVAFRERDRHGFFPGVHHSQIIG